MSTDTATTIGQAMSRAPGGARSRATRAATGGTGTATGRGGCTLAHFAHSFTVSVIEDVYLDETVIHLPPRPTPASAPLIPHRTPKRSQTRFLRSGTSSGRSNGTASTRTDADDEQHPTSGMRWGCCLVTQRSRSPSSSRTNSEPGASMGERG